ncbi:hypothetical protein D3C85_1823680 [compost metagenome]
MKETFAGNGTLNYPLFVELLKQHKPHVHMTLESVAPSDMESALRFLKGLY